MFEYLPQAITSLSVASNIAKSMLELRDFAQLNSKVIELQQTIISAQQQILSGQTEQSSLSAKIQELERECIRLQEWSTERENYDLKEIASGVFARIEKNFLGSFQSAHKLCTTCFEKGKKSILQQQSVEIGRKLSITCHCCNSTIVFRHYIDQS